MSTLIIVEDNDVDRLIAQYSLVKYPVFDDIVYYDEGTSLVNYLKDNKNNPANLPDAIFLDLRMPDYDGWQVLDDINDFYPELQKAVRIYVVSASISSHDRLRALKYSFVHQFISKPLTKDVLMNISHDFLDKTA